MGVKVLSNIFRFSEPCLSCIGFGTATSTKYKETLRFVSFRFCNILLYQRFASFRFEISFRFVSFPLLTYYLSLRFVSPARLVSFRFSVHTSLRFDSSRFVSFPGKVKSVHGASWLVAAKHPKQRRTALTAYKAYC